MTRWRQFWCGVRGHDWVLQFEFGHLFTRCVSCGAESIGWTWQVKA